MTLLLDEAAVRSLLHWADLIPLMERTLAAFSTGGAVQPVRTMVRMERARTFAARMASHTGLRVEASDDPERAAAEAQMIVTATASPTPVLHGAWLAPGTHVSAVGACTPETRELDGAAVARMRVFVD